LLKIWGNSIQVHLPDVRDECSSLDATSENALGYFKQGMGLLFKDVHQNSEQLSHWLEEMRKVLGISALTYARCLIYATPDGKGTAPHFDQNYNFVFQVHGIKKWKVARNHQVTNPMTRHTMGQPTDPELDTYLDDELPTEMPDDAISFELKPGSMLYVPRGWWHSTEAEGDALALNFTFSAPTWLDLFTAALRSRLALSDEWRETARGLTDEKQREMAEDQLDSLLSTLVDDLPNWRAADILNVTDG